MFKTIRRWLRNSSRIHLREQPVSDLRSCVALLDRFLDDRLRYPLEWDDFISWNHDSPSIESIRLIVADTEPMFFSKDPSQRRRARAMVITERNRVAAIVGLLERADEHPTSGAA
jgi:hypothetical protein